MIELFIVSFVAGILTVLAPCILPILPVIIGGGSLHQDDRRDVSLRHPLTIIASLVLSIVLSTLLLKATTALLGIPAAVWTTISGGIVLLFGLNLLLPMLWEKIMIITGFATMSNRMMGKSQSKSGIKRDIFLGAALGPVFNSCSPTYALIVAVVLPTSFVEGLGYLLAYTLGLGLILLLVSIFGSVLVHKMKWASNPNGIFQKMVGIIFVIIGLIIIVGIDKKLQEYVLAKGWYDPVMKIEESFRSK